MKPVRFPRLPAWSVPIRRAAPREYVATRNGIRRRRTGARIVGSSLENCELPGKKAVFSQFLRDGIWIAPDGVAYMGRCIRTERYRYVEWKKKDGDQIVARELYDLQLDPQENNNVASKPQNLETVEQLASRLRAGWKARPRKGVRPQ